MSFVTLRGSRGLLPAAAALIFLSAAAQAEGPGEADKADKAEAPELLLGDMGGLRPTLKASGVKLGISYVGEVFGNVSGGLKRGVVYDGQIGMFLNFNLEKLAGWSGARVHVHAFQINGRGPSANLVGNLMTLSGIEATAIRPAHVVEAKAVRGWNVAQPRLQRIEFIVSETALSQSTRLWLANSDRREHQRRPRLSATDTSIAFS